MDALRDLLAHGYTREARKRAEERLAKDAFDLEALLALAKAQLVEGALASAEATLLRAEAAGVTADTEILRGNLCGQRSEVDAARAHYRHATELDPAKAEAWFGYAVFVAAEERYRESLPLFEKAVE